MNDTDWIREHGFVIDVSTVNFYGTSSFCCCSDAKEKALNLSNLGYTKPTRKKIKVLGKEGLGMFMVGAHSMHAAGYITQHEKLMSEKLAYVICGGDLSTPTLVSEQYLLDLEREAFLSLCGERKTLERIEHMMKKGKPLRN